MSSNKVYQILWADDEIDLLKPHILFLKEKGYEVTPVLSGADAIEAVQTQNFDLIFLDENMPGITGLDALQRIKELRPFLPVIMITKSEEEELMNQAIGGKITDYLIKPVNPNQLLLSLKKNLHQSTIISEATTMNYRQEFAQLSAQMSDRLSIDEWKDLYRRLVHWEIEAADTAVPSGFWLHALRCFCSFIAAYGFAMLFNSRAKASLLAAIVGAMANTARLVLIDFHVPWQLAVGLAAVTIGLLAQLFVSRASLSRVALSVPAVVIMIPGVPFYRAISALNNQTVEANVAVGQAAGNLAEVFFVITAIGVGLAVARILTDRNWRHDVATSGHIVLPESHGSSSEPHRH